MVNVMDVSDADVLSAPRLLSIELPAWFDEALGIQHPGRWLGIYWEPELEQVCYTDGDTVSMGNAQSWQLFCTHPKVEPVLAPYELGSRDRTAKHFLLLDRENSQLYVAESSVIEDYLQHPDSLNLLAALDAPPSRLRFRSLSSLQPLRRKLSRTVRDKRWLFLFGVPAIAIGIYLLDEVADFMFDLIEFWDD